MGGSILAGLPGKGNERVTPNNEAYPGFSTALPVQDTLPHGTAMNSVWPLSHPRVGQSMMVAVPDEAVLDTWWEKKRRRLSGPLPELPRNTA